MPPPCTADCAGIAQLEELFGRVIHISVGIAFVALIIFLVWAGIKFITSGGEPKAIQSAQQTVTWALLGMLFLVVAWLVLQLIGAFTGVNVTLFDLTKLCIGGNCL